MIKAFAIAALSLVMVAGATASSARSAERSNSEIAAGVAVAVVGGLLIGKAYQNYKTKREEKKVNKTMLRNFNQLKKDSAGNIETFKATWGPRCQKVKADLKAANCDGNTTLKCRKIAANCPL